MSASLVGLVPQLLTTTVVSSMVLSLDPTLVSRALQRPMRCLQKFASRDCDERMKLMNEAEKKMMQTYALIFLSTVQTATLLRVLPILVHHSSRAYLQPLLVGEVSRDEAIFSQSSFEEKSFKFSLKC